MLKKVVTKLPAEIQGAVALSYDLEMCAGYAPDGVNHGRIIPEVQDYTLKLCETAEKYDVNLHFFYVCDGLEEDNIDFLKEIVNRGHVIDSHTYSHQGIAIVNPEQLDYELSRANQLLNERLGVISTILRGPYGYKHGQLPPENRKVILNNGFNWVSGEFNDAVYDEAVTFSYKAGERDLPYAYPDGLIEIPFQGWSDRMWFDMRPEVDQSVIDAWRVEFGHQPVPKGWKAPWLLPSALEDWIDLNLRTLDYTYDHNLLWIPVWHPLTHYLHDPGNRMLEAFLAHAASKPNGLRVCTLRDATRWMTVER